MARNKAFCKACYWADDYSKSFKYNLIQHLILYPDFSKFMLNVLLISCVC